MSDKRFYKLKQIIPTINGEGEQETHWGEIGRFNPTQGGKGLFGSVVLTGRGEIKCFVDHVKAEEKDLYLVKKIVPFRNEQGELEDGFFVFGQLYKTEKGFFGSICLGAAHEKGTKVFLEAVMRAPTHKDVEGVPF